MTSDGPDTAPTRPDSILVVDDEALMQTLLREILTPEGYDVATADDGQQAVDLLGRAQFDLIITDMAMPGLDGVECCAPLSAPTQTAR